LGFKLKSKIFKPIKTRFLAEINYLTAKFYYEEHDKSEVFFYFENSCAFLIFLEKIKEKLSFDFSCYAEYEKCLVD
jgi:hypothetical protein